MTLYVNFNGTARETLVETRIEVMEKLRDTMAALTETCPHMRDYSSPEEYNKDRKIYTERFAALDKMCNEILDEAVQIQDM